MYNQVILNGRENVDKETNRKRGNSTCWRETVLGISLFISVCINVREKDEGVCSVTACQRETTGVFLRSTRLNSG